MIRIENLEVNYGINKVLKGINHVFETGFVHGIVGLNGSGKTTFFNTITKNVQPNEGAIFFDDEKLKREQTAYLETSNYFYSGITGNEYLKIFNQTNPDFNLDNLQQYLKLPLDEITENYSTGMRKKLALLAILKQNKNIYLLDEPFNGLDLETHKVLELIIVALKNKGKTILISSHIIDPLITVCDKIHVLDSGVFKKSYPKENFNELEEALFSELKNSAKIIIDKSV